MARAKRTERSEARRRYRAATVGAAPEGEAPPDDDVVPAAALPRGARERRPASASVVEPAPRPGFLGALRGAAGPADIRGDLRAFPGLLLGSKAALIPGAVIVATAVALMVPALASNSLVALAGNVILQPPPMIIAFLAGMLAPRASWLMGGLMSFLATAAFLLQYFARTETLVTPLGFTVTLAPADKMAIGGAALAGSLLSGLMFGLAVGAFAGFYRRFLNMSTQQRQTQRRR